MKIEIEGKPERVAILSETAFSTFMAFHPPERLALFEAFFMHVFGGIEPEFSEPLAGKAWQRFKDEIDAINIDKEEGTPNG